VVEVPALSVSELCTIEEHDLDHMFNKTEREMCISLLSSS